MCRTTGTFCRGEKNDAAFLSGRLFDTSYAGVGEACFAWSVVNKLGLRACKHDRDTIPRENCHCLVSGCNSYAGRFQPWIPSFSQNSQCILP